TCSFQFAGVNLTGTSYSTPSVTQPFDTFTRLIRTNGRDRQQPETAMMIASMTSTTLRQRPLEHRTEPRLLAQMQKPEHGNTKLKPTVFMRSALLGEEGRGKR